MKINRRWDLCINHRGIETQQFIKSYFTEPQRQVQIIAGAGFDPRSVIICEQLSQILDNRIKGLFFREERPNPDQELMERAQRNQERLQSLVPKSQIEFIQIFAADGAVIGGRRAVNIIQELDLEQVTDIIVDFSALSVGIAFPIVRALFMQAERNYSKFNLHLMVTDEPLTDDQISSIASDNVRMIHGFNGGFGLDQFSDAAKLWLPQLIKGRRPVLEKIYNYLRPHDVCPILPFPASNPRLADELIEYYSQEFESAWQIDTRNILYADEKNPIDLYRTILRIDEARHRVFNGVGGSLIILSPIGSKALALGALMAAIERDFPIAHVESISYMVDFAKLDTQRSESGEITHIWLYGDAYNAVSSKEGKEI